MAHRQCAHARCVDRDSSGGGGPLARSTPAPILVSGYYGLGNLGDEAVLAGLLSGLRARYPAARIVVLSGNPGATQRMHNVEAWSRAPRGVWRALRGARLLISGGGSLLQDATSARSAVYYAGTMLAASARGVPVAVVGQGVGPLRRKWVRSLTARALRRAALISLRDDESVALLRTIGVDRHIERSADLAFLLPAPKPGSGDALLSAAGVSGGRPRIGVAFRPWPGLPDPEAFGRAVRMGSNGTIVALPFDRAHDGEVSRRVAAGGEGVTIDASTPHDLLAVVAAMDAVVAVRLHALIFAVRCGVPALAIAYDPKVRAFAEEIGAPCLPATASVDAIAKECAAMVPDASVRRAPSAAALRRLEDLANRGLDALRPWADTP